MCRSKKYFKLYNNLEKFFLCYHKQRQKHNKSKLESSKNGSLDKKQTTWPQQPFNKYKYTKRSANPKTTFEK